MVNETINDVLKRVTAAQPEVFLEGHEGYYRHSDIARLIRELPTALSDDFVRDNMLRRMTDRLVQSDHFKPATTSRIKRIQMAYDLACELEEEIRREVMA